MIFYNRILPGMIKYMWSGIVPVGLRFIRPLYSRARFVVLRSGAAEPGQWFEERLTSMRTTKNLQRRAREGAGHRAHEQLELDAKRRGRRL